MINLDKCDKTFIKGNCKFYVISYVNRDVFAKNVSHYLWATPGMAASVSRVQSSAITTQIYA